MLYSIAVSHSKSTSLLEVKVPLKSKKVTGKTTIQLGGKKTVLESKRMAPDIVKALPSRSVASPRSNSPSTISVPLKTELSPEPKAPVTLQ